MPLNKNAIARYRRLDACFKDQNKQYYIEDLIRECSDAIRTSDDSKRQSTEVRCSLTSSTLWKNIPMR